MALALYLGAHVYLESQANAAVARAQAQLPLVRLDAAIEALYAARSLTPKNPNIHNEIGRIEVMRWRWQRDPSAAIRAISAYERAAALDPLSAVHHSDRGWALIRLGRPLEALDAFAAALERDPFNAYYLASLGRALEQAGDLEGALDAFERSRAVRNTREVRTEIATLIDAIAAARTSTPNGTGNP